MKNNKELLWDVQEALTQNPLLKENLSDLYVLVNDGAVIIAGNVGNPNLRQLAEQIVRNIPDVKFLINDIKVGVPDRQRVAVQIDWANGKMALTS
ncbi:MAG TPA: BON domain-containing protein [Ohtaekwangia sp.]|uniref:BON domain-containing protein n=1 Tax=Ohtaekwangia sp. TaxID=2066019 RepID=UPI002F95CECA